MKIKFQNQIETEGERKHDINMPETKIQVICLNPFPNKPCFLLVCSPFPFKNTSEKGEIARNEQFLFFPQCFLPVWGALCIFKKIEIVGCKLFQFGRV